jgi:hypothetical protein
MKCWGIVYEICAGCIEKNTRHSLGLQNIDKSKKTKNWGMHHIHESEKLILSVCQYPLNWSANALQLVFHKPCHNNGHTESKIK